MSKVLLLVLVTACGHAPVSDPTPAPTVGCLADAGVTGAIAMRSDSDSAARCVEGTLCATRYLPASTFKIPNSMIGLETGVVSGPEFTLPWDGTAQRIEAWNRDHTLRTAIANSVVWYYQEVARRIGETRMAEWLARLDYGNRDIGGGIDRFWLDGALRISPFEQVEFLRRFERGELPIANATGDVVRSIIELDRGPGWVLRGKTGWALRTEEEVLWLVGWVEGATDERRTYFATVIVSPPEQVDRLAVRQQVTRCALAAVGAITAP